MKYPLALAAVAAGLSLASAANATVFIVGERIDNEDGSVGG